MDREYSKELTDLMPVVMHRIAGLDCPGRVVATVEGRTVALVDGDLVAFHNESIQSRRVVATRTHSNGTVEILIQGDTENRYKDKWYPASAIE